MGVLAVLGRSREEAASRGEGPEATGRRELGTVEHDDHRLVNDAADGDESAFELLVRRHTDAVWRMAWSMMRDDFAAEEAVQDTFLKAYRNLHSFRGDSKVSTWLISICRRSCLDMLRRKRHDVVSLDEVRRTHGREDRTDLKVAVEGALDDLPDDEREAFTLVEIIGHTREEAASIVDVPPSTMRSRVSRARAKLARALSEARWEATGE